MDQLRPIAGATKGGRRPKTVLTCDRGTLTVTDHASGESRTVTPARLYHYRVKRTSSAKGGQRLHGLAALDADGLVLLDLPGEWYGKDLRRFADRAGIPLEDAREYASRPVRVALASRAPGWRRIRGLRAPSAGAWRKPVGICLAVAGAALMAYFISMGMWAAWRGLSMAGRLVLDLLDAKWFLALFSPALLVFRPLVVKFHRIRVRKGLVLGPHGGPGLTMGARNVLQVTQGKEVLDEVRMGRAYGRAFRLLLYRFEHLTGLAVLDSQDRVLHHLPGPWSPEEADRFAKRHELLLAVHRVSREEYLALTRNAREATP
ncbi:hypothetical protein [Nonomuraea candida]|uniref:hypothetical protein n=1 Tax=Nonomuraea candida TaxID=359159 RepID=UPI0005BBF966|nr:hypothetical protein [Nonomuraea candida]